MVRSRLLAASVASLAWLAWLLHGAPASIVALAVLPIAAWALASYAGARRAGVPAVLLLGAFVWGAAGAAPLSAWLSDTLRPRLDLAPGTYPAGDFATLVAPLIEEASKGLVLLLLPLFARHAPTSSIRAGIALGAASGLGFAATENVGYLTVAVLQGGMPGLLQAAWVRGILTGVKHALFTATAGAGVGLALGRSRRGGAALCVGAGFAAAVLQHVAWNGLVAPLLHEILCAAPAPGASCTPLAGPLPLLAWAPLVVAAALGPGIALLVWLARRERRDDEFACHGASGRF